MWSCKVVVSIKTEAEKDEALLNGDPFKRRAAGIQHIENACMLSYLKSSRAQRWQDSDTDYTIKYVVSRKLGTIVQAKRVA